MFLLVRAFKFRRIVCLPSQHCTGGIFLNQGVYQLLCVVTLPHIFPLKSRNEELPLIKFIKCLTDLHRKLLCETLRSIPPNHSPTRSEKRREGKVGGNKCRAQW